ncbi:MAG: transposase [Nitrospiraceae bacterium]|nr:transposase [Nitrospiraceae bacterium]
MPRTARAVAQGFPHHITQRGNYRQTVFSGPHDYEQYLNWLRDYSVKYSLKIWAYCLMKNHVHFIAMPVTVDSMARTLKMLHMRYSQYFNAKKEMCGHLWQGRFFSCVLDEKHLYAAVRYIENNPVRAGVVSKAEEYRWSSAGAHVLGSKDMVLSGDCPITDGIKNWAAYLREGEDEKDLTAIRENTKTGRPCGDEFFVIKIENMLGRQLRRSKGGRPRKKK